MKNYYFEKYYFKFYRDFVNCNIRIFQFNSEPLHPEIICSWIVKLK